MSETIPEILQVETDIEKEIISLLNNVELNKILRLRYGETKGEIEGELTHEEYDYVWYLNADIELDTRSFLSDIDNNTEYLLSTLLENIENIMPTDPPDYDPRFISIIGLLENVTENQVEMAFLSRDNATDIIDAVEDLENDNINNIMIDIDDTLSDISDSIETSSLDAQDFIGACLEGISDTLETVGTAIYSGIENTAEIIEPALTTIGTVYEYMLEKLLELLKSLFTIDPAQISEYMKTFLDTFQSFLPTTG